GPARRGAGDQPDPELCVLGSAGRPETEASVKRRRDAKAANPVERLRSICLALPDTTEKVAWGEPTWRVRGRLFAQLADHHHGAGGLAVGLPAGLGVQELLVKSDPDRFFVPPYVGPRGWVGVRIDGRPNWKTVGTLVSDAHAYAASKQADPRRSRTHRKE